MSTSRPSRPCLFALPPTRYRARFSALLMLSVVGPFAGSTMNAATFTFTAGGLDQFSNTSNWSTGTAPGATSGTTNTDTATFGINETYNDILNIDTYRNLGSFNFVLGTTSFTIGGVPSGTTPRNSASTANTGNSLLLSSGGAITITSAVTATVTETFNAPLVLEGASATTAGTYAFTNNGTSTTTALVFGGNITSGTSGGVTLTLGGTNTGTGNVISSVIGGGSGTIVLTKQDAGSWSLTGANTYTGATTVNSGTLKLDFSGTAATVPTTNILYNGLTLTAGSGLEGLALGGGTLSVAGKASVANSQQFNGLTVNAGGSAVSVVPGTSGTVTLSLGTISRNTGGTVDFSTTGTIDTTTTTNTNGILGGYATVGGAGWAVAPTTSSGAIAALGTYTTTATAANTASNYLNANIDVTTSPSPTAAINPNSLRFNTAAGDTLTLTGTNIVSTGGILMTSTVASHISTITGGTLEGASGNDLVVIQNDTSTNSGLTIASAIADNTSATALTKSGAGTLTLTGSNSYTGGTYFNGGVINVGSTGALGTTGTLYFNGAGGTLQYSAANTTDYSGRISTANNQSIKIDTGTQTVAFATGLSGTNTNFTKLGTGTLTLNAVDTYTGQTTVSAGTLTLGVAGADSGSTVTVPSAGTLTDSVTNGLSGTAGLSVTGGTVALGVANNYTGPTTLSSGTLTLGVAGAISAGTTTLIGGTFTESVVNGLSGTAALVISSSTFSLPVANSYTGGTSVGAATVNVGDNAAFGTGPISTGNTTFNNTTGGTLTIANPVTLGGNLSIPGTNPVAFTGLVTNNANAQGLILSDTGGVTLSGGLALSNGSVTMFITGAGNLNVTGVLSGIGGLTYNGTGVMTLSNSGNTYSKTLTVDSGEVLLGNGANLGNGSQGLTVTSNSSAPALGTGTVDLGGNGTSSAGVATGAVTVTGPATIQNGYLQPSGTGVTISAPVTGQNTGTSTISANIIGTAALTSAASTTAILSGANTYTGATSISGMLTLTGSLGSTAVAVNSGGTLTGGGTIGGSLTLNNGGTITPGTAGTSTGVLTANNLTFNSGGMLTYTLSNSDTTTGLLALNGGLLKGTTGTFNIMLSGGVAGDTYELVSFASGTTFSSTDFTAVGDSGMFSIDPSDSFLDFTLSATAVPEPAPAAMMGTFLLLTSFFSPQVRAHGKRFLRA